MGQHNVLVLNVSNLVGYYLQVSLSYGQAVHLISLFFNTHLGKSEKSKCKDKSTRWWDHGGKQRELSIFGPHPQLCQTVSCFALVSRSHIIPSTHSTIKQKYDKTEGNEQSKLQQSEAMENKNQGGCKHMRGRVTGLAHWCCNPEVLGSRPPPCHQWDYFVSCQS